MDWKAYVDRTLERYDRWISEGRMTHSSKVVPVGRSLRPKQWVLPSEQVLGFLREAKSFALAECLCRALADRCDKPREICFYLGAFADKRVAAGQARRVGLDEAEAVLRRADEAGLVHLTLYDGSRQVFAVCSCCACCCHDLHALMARGRQDLVARSEYVAVTDVAACTACGACVDRCAFGAREVVDGHLVAPPERCYGCGLCITTCPTGAVVLEATDETG